MKTYKVTNINKYGEEIKDLTKYKLPQELQDRIYQLMLGERKIA